MKVPGFNAEVSLYKTNTHYQQITRQAGLAGGQAVIPQSHCDAFAERAVQYVQLASKASAQGDFWLAQQYLHEVQSWVALYQDCEAAHTR